MPRSILLLLAWLFVLPVARAADNGPALPRQWHGKWSGTLTVRTLEGKPFDKAMELEIKPIREGKAYSWHMVTSRGGQKLVRDYDLVPVAGKSGQFVIDEKNGIGLNTQLMGNTLYAYYKDGDILICSRFELRGDSLQVELASVLTKEPRVSILKEEKIEIQSYQLGSTQTGELKRK
jgi:hypothetical protein